MMNRKCIRVISVLSVVLIELWTMSLSAMPLCAELDSVHTIGSVVVTARADAQRLMQTNLEQQMTDSAMAVSGLLGVADVVKRFAGVAVRDYGGIGGMKTVGVRGAGAGHTAVSYGGIVVSNTQAGQIDIGRFSTDRLQSVGVAVGQSSGTLLSSRHLASAAVVEMNPQDALPHSGRANYAARLSGGSFGFLSALLSTTQRIADGVGVAAMLDYTRADGIYPFVLHNGSKTTHEKRHGSDVESVRGEASLSALLRRGRLDACLNYYRSERGLPGSVVYYVNEAHERLWDEHWSAQALMRIALNSKTDMAIRGKYSHSWNKYEDRDVKYSGGVRTDIYHQSEYYLASTVEWRPINPLRLSLAEDVAVATLTSNVGEQPDPLRLTSLTSLRAVLQMERWNVDAYAVVTAMSDHNCGKKTAKVTSRDLSQLVPQPSVGVSFRLLPNEKLYLRARMKYTFRVPTFTDMYYLHIGNSDLKPERAHTWSCGVAWSHDFFEKTSLMLVCDAYINNVSDKIVAFPTTYVWKMLNIGEARIKGIDMVAEATMRLWRSVDLRLNGAYTYQDARNRTTELSALYGLLLPYSPHHQGSATLSVGYRWLTMAYQLSFCSSRYSNQQNLKEYRISPYDEHSMTFSGRFNIKRTSMMASLSIINLTDCQYEVVKFYPMPGRYLRMTLRAEF